VSESTLYHGGMGSKTIRLQVNGTGRTVEPVAGATLIDILRNDLGLKATRFGCGTEQCGACVVLVDGKPAYSCTMPAESAAGHAITTVEGLGTRESPHRLQQAFIDEQAAQCGYCTSGMLMSAAALLARTPHPSEAQVREALEANLCRCGTYHRAVRAVLRAANARQTA
jgi:nicotinate dehydrogenase subunit A